MPPTPQFALPPNFPDLILAIALAATMAGALALAAGRLARRGLAAAEREAYVTGPLANRTIRIVRTTTFLVAFAVLAFPALDLAGVKLGAGLQSQQLGQWAAGKGVRIAALLLLAFAVIRILSTLILRAERDLTAGTGLDAIERRKRAQTLANVVRGGLSVLIWTTAVLMVLRELDVDITPVLTGAGIVGLAIGFGAQTLVRDVISGFFLIVEDQIRVGDVATVNGIGGLVEQINLRTIVLRDLEGAVHVIPNGEIKTLSNRTKDYSYYVITLGIDYGEDADRVIESVREAYRSLAADAAFSVSILEPVEILGIDDFSGSDIKLKFRIKTVPLKQWEVGRELRRRIKQVFDQRGIRIPFPQLEVTLRPPEGAAVAPPGATATPTPPSRPSNPQVS